MTNTELPLSEFLYHDIHGEQDLYETFLALLDSSQIKAMMAAVEMDAEFQKTERKNARYWVSPYLKERNDKGRFISDFEALRNSPDLFVKNFSIPPIVIDELYEMMKPHLLPKRNSRPKDFIPTKAKLAVGLEYAS